MSKVAHYLQEHLIGEVMSNPDARKYFATDGSVFRLDPALVVYPRSENDVRKTARFCWQLAERGRVIPITARGLGSTQSGAALGSGIMMVFPAHLNKIVELDSKTGDVTAETGINYGKLQQTLLTHGRFLPPYPASIEYSTLGGAIATNASGEQSLKYGSTRQFVKRLRVVLANGEVIETGRISRRDLNKKMGLTTMEGDIYRQLDKLIEENYDLIQSSVLPVSKNSSGYDLADVKHKDGSFDLTPLLVGSEGTLGMVTEATLGTQVHNLTTTLIVALFDEIEAAQAAISELVDFSEPPAKLEMVDENLLKFVNKSNPSFLKGIIDPPFPKLALLIEYDTSTDRIQKRAVKRAFKILKHNGATYQVETEPDAKERLWKIHDAVSMVLSHSLGGSRPLPVIEDGIVPLERLQEYIGAIYRLFKSHNLAPVLWGHAGNANLHVMPLLDLAQVGDRQKIFKLMDDHFSLIMSLGGSLSGSRGDGRLRGPYLEKLYGSEVYNLFIQVKRIFDPMNILNPGVKIGVDIEDVKPLLRPDYALGQVYNHLPRG
jgi:FAD/FMN-containing dehydrogenase